MKPIGAKEIVNTFDGKSIVVRKCIGVSPSEVDLSSLDELYKVNPVLRGKIKSRKMDVLWPTASGNRKFIDNVFVGLQKVASLVL